ncbi:capsular polysaccharide synthesis protein [Diaphorobacter sp. LR2014-1]|uniref:glycosyltransferase family 32 protein n=1 Tax=Diaphorobacter sp. LR2014-1 TaxID=1933219 RepID=UPI000CDB1555|nr:capsular polysaccharide synthesis protein [Diaphorobacter sp. LR2014-1]POR12714.1 mannosyltransferase [Diaphorobacter sp. LR2014-1]
MTAPVAATGWKHRGELWLARGLRRWYKTCPLWLEGAAAPEFTLYATGAADAQPTAATAIPRIIWAYWNGATPPLLVRRCFDNWRRLHPHFEIRTLDERSVLQYLPAIPPALDGASPAKRADWIRLELLSRHGGIWLDASTILTQPLDWVLEQQARTGADFVGYYLQQFTSVPERPVIENWFMAAPPASPFIADLQREFTQEVVPRTGEQYIDHLRELGLYAQALQRIDGPAYLSMHMALQVVLLRGGHYRLCLERAESGPFLYHVLGRWNRAALKLRLLFARIGGPLPPLIKLRGPDRRRLDDYLARGLYLPDSVAGRWLDADRVNAR